MYLFHRSQPEAQSEDQPATTDKRVHRETKHAARHENCADPAGEILFTGEGVDWTSHDMRMWQKGVFPMRCCKKR